MHALWAAQKLGAPQVVESAPNATATTSWRMKFAVQRLLTAGIAMLTRNAPKGDARGVTAATSTACTMVACIATPEASAEHAKKDTRFAGTRISSTANATLHYQSQSREQLKRTPPSGAALGTTTLTGLHPTDSITVGKTKSVLVLNHVATASFKSRGHASRLKEVRSLAAPIRMR